MGKVVRNRNTVLQISLFIAVLMLGLWLRLRNLDAVPMWADEAETSINALTILEKGYPIDHYLGLPIFENTLIKPWPDHPEYEFKDISYSDRGIAIYHGWLPLYAVAASFRLFGIQPHSQREHPSPEWRVREWRRQTMAARVPSVILGMALLPLLFIAGRRLSSSMTGWTAMLFGSVFPVTVSYSRQARYYSATVLLTLVCALLLVVWLERRRWRDTIVAALALAALFHSHLLSFALFGAFFGGATVWLLWRHTEAWPKLAVFWFLTTLFTLPWILGTGFLEQAAGIPSARGYLGWADLFSYPLDKGRYTLVGAAGLALVLISFRFADKLPKVAVPFRGMLVPYTVLIGWITAAYFLFLLCIPLGSFFYERLSMMLVPACILCVSYVLTSVSSLIDKGHAGAGAALLAMIFLGAPRTIVVPEVNWHEWEDLSRLQAVAGFATKPGTRWYATPNDHLILTFYTGIPVQSVAPVRREFLNQYEQPVVILERLQLEPKDSSPLAWQNLQDAAYRAGENLTALEAETLSLDLATQELRRRLQCEVGAVYPSPQPLPAYAEEVLRRHRMEDREDWRKEIEAVQGSPIFRGFAVNTWSDWWPIFFYRFVGPDARRGTHLNYYKRIREADAHILGASWIVYWAEKPVRQERNKRSSKNLSSRLLRRWARVRHND